MRNASFITNESKTVVRSKLLKNHYTKCKVECAIFHLVLLFWYVIVNHKKENMRCFMAFHLMGPMWHIVWHNIKLCITRYMIKVSTTGTLPHIWKLKRQHHIIIVWQIYALTRDFKRKKWGGILNNCHFPTIFSVLLPLYTYERITFQEEY